MSWSKKKLSIENSDISSDDIGFKIAPLINAVGRIDNPKLIVDLLLYKYLRIVGIGMDFSHHLKK